MRRVARRRRRRDPARRKLVAQQFEVAPLLPASGRRKKCAALEDFTRRGLRHRLVRLRRRPRRLWKMPLHGRALLSSFSCWLAGRRRAHRRLLRSRSGCGVRGAGADEVAAAPQQESFGRWRPHLEVAAALCRRLVLFRWREQRTLARVLRGAIGSKDVLAALSRSHGHTALSRLVAGRGRALAALCKHC